MLQDEAVRSAQIYLDYLNAHKDDGLGMVRARVKSIQSSLLSKEIVMTMDRIIKSADGLVLRIGERTYENSQDEEFFRILSISKRKVVMEPSPEVAVEIEAAFDGKQRLLLESDLTFLVKRVKSWYEKHGGQVFLPAVRPVCKLNPENPIALSDNQYNCAALAMTSPLTYIWGAPGTGKTKHVLASCVLSYLRAGKKVLLVAPTNNALEQSLGGLLRALEKEGGVDPAGTVVRLGVPGDAFRTVWPDVCEDGAMDWLKQHISEKVSRLHYLNNKIDETLAFREGKGTEGAKDAFSGKTIRELKIQRRKNAEIANDLLAKSRKLTEARNIMPLIGEFSVVAATVDTCLYRISPDGAFVPDHVFLDEAGYCNVIKGMTLLGFGKPLTLLGDHMQLPPVFEGENDLLKDPEKKLARLWEISSLYLEDAVTCGDLNALCGREPERPKLERTQIGALTETHRFGPALAEVLARRVYGPRFCSQPVNETKIVFLNAPKTADDKERDEEGKLRRISHAEAKCIRTLMESNLSHLGVTVGIITPYRKQRRLLAETMERLLKKHQIDESDMEDDIVTVHQSQGREWDIVLFSVTDCFEERHFTDTRRPGPALKLINTAVSRAKKMLVLVGDAEDWRGRPGQLISELFFVASEIGPKENVVEQVQGKDPEEEFVPWKDNYGSLYMALSIGEK